MQGSAFHHLTRRTLIASSLSAGVIGGKAIGATLSQFTSGAQGEGRFDHGALDGLLRRRVSASRDGVNRVAYRAWAASADDRSTLLAYLRRMQATDPRTLTRPEQIAFWINLYNAETLRIVLDAYPVRSIRDIRPGLVSIGPWGAKTLMVSGQRLSLDEVENSILRPGFRDARIHYALNCASMGCPNLRPAAWRGADLDAGLNAAARDYVNHPRGVRAQTNGVRLSSIYQWYREDFGTGRDGVFVHLERFAASDLAGVIRQRPRILGHDYDWALNDVV